MSGSTKALVLDVNSKPAPQYYNPTSDAYEYLQGKNGGAFANVLSANGSFTATNKSVTTTAAQLDAGLASRAFVHVFNRGTADIFIGPSNAVTSTTGYPIPAGTDKVLAWGPGLAVWGIAATGTQDVRVMEVAQ